MEYTIEQVQLDELDAAVVPGRMAVADIAEFIGGAFAEVVGVLQAQGVEITGMPFGLYSPPDDGVFDLLAGFPCAGPVTPAGRVVPHRLPRGPALQTMHVGDYAEVTGAYHALEEHMSGQGLAPAGAPWESYFDEPDVAEPRTLVTWPVRTS